MTPAEKFPELKDDMRRFREIFGAKVVYAKNDQHEMGTLEELKLGENLLRTVINPE